MSFGGLLFTNLGKNLQAKAVAGIQLNFTKIAIGDGELGPGSILDLKNVVHEIKALYITKLKSTPDGKAIIGTTFDNNNITTGFYWREIGVYANDPVAGEILYCYSNAGTNAEYIPASGGAQIIEKALDLTVIIGNATNVTATLASGIYASKEDLDLKADLVDGKVPSNQLPEMNYLSPNGEGKDITVTFTEAGTRENISTTEKLSVIFGKIKKFFTDLKTVAFTGSYTDLMNKPTSLPANGGVADSCSGNAATATKLQTARNINGVAFDGTQNITVADSTKAPTNHASTGTTYGLGTASNFGHVKTINSLVQSSNLDGTALSAYQGKIIKDLIDTLTNKFNLNKFPNRRIEKTTTIPPTNYLANTPALVDTIPLTEPVNMIYIEGIVMGVHGSGVFGYLDKTMYFLCQNTIPTGLYSVCGGIVLNGIFFAHHTDTQYGFGFKLNGTSLEIYYVIFAGYNMTSNRPLTTKIYY